MALELIRVACDAPDDVARLDAVDATLRSGIRAVLGKTEGNGCVNDFTRALAARAWRDALGSEVVTVMSGGTEGVLAPHVSLLVDVANGDVATGGLSLGTATSRPIAPEDIGRSGQAVAVRDAVRAAAAAGGFPPERAAMVVSKCPLLTTEKITAAARAGRPTITTDTYESMGASRGATAIGIGLACGELDGAEAERALAGDLDVYSAIASTSAGVELDACEIVAIGPSERSSGTLHAVTGVMADACDAGVVMRLLGEIEERGGEPVQVFAKCEPDPSGRIRGSRHTMLTDSDINATRHARAAVGGLLAGLVGRTDLYVSGGAEHQGPPGGGNITIVWRTRPDPAA